MKVLIDTDPGCDDCAAITIFLSHPSAEVQALTTVFGNSSVDVSTTNACRILEFMSRKDIPIYKGAHKNLLGIDNISATWFHGKDGLNDVSHIIPMNTEKSAEQSRSAPEAIIELLKSHPGEISLIALGPLTNIAIATCLCPELPSLAKGLYLMGGSSYHGNVTRWAEYNFYADSLAAHVTLQAFSKSGLVHMVPWETCINNTISLEKYHSLFEVPEKTPVHTLMKATGLAETRLEREKKGELDEYMFADQFLPALLLYPESVTKKELYKTVKVNYDINDEKRGQAEYVPHENGESGGVGVVIYTHFDMECIVNMYKNSISG